MNTSKNKRRRKAKGKDMTTNTRTNQRSNNAECVRDTEKNNTFGGNAVEWYSRYPNLLLAAGSIPYPYKPGMAVPIGNYKEFLSQGAAHVVNSAIPGIMTINWIPSVGYSDDPTSPISIVGKEVYAKVREKFSGAIDADAPDFVIYLLALDAVFSYIASLKRIYRVLNAYSPENIFTPDGILYALGLNQTQVLDLRAHKMEFYQRINELVLMTRKFKCPRIMDLFNRHVWLNDHVYTDAPTVKSQFYIFKQTAWYQFSMEQAWNGAEGVLAGSLISTSLSIPGTGVVDYLYTFGRNLIDALASSDDGYLISGYLMRAYEGVPEFYVDELLMGEVLIPKYNEEVLGEIENAHSIAPGVSRVNNAIYQDPSTNSIISHPMAVYAQDGATARLGLDGIYPRYNSRSDNPTVAETVVNSRLMTYLEPFGVGETAYSTKIVCCTEIVTSFVITERNPDPVATVLYTNLVFHSETFLNFGGSYASSSIAQLARLIKATQWDWMPMVLVICDNNTAEANVLMGDIHNITSSDMAALKNINTVCLYSLFNAFSQ